MKPQIILVVIGTAMLCFSCKKQVVRPAPAIKEIEFRIDEKNKIQLIKEIAAILEKVYENDSAWKEVNAAIFTGKYRDERVLLSDLINEDSTGIFKTLFWKTADAGNYRMVNEMLRPRPRKPVAQAGVVASEAQIPELTAPQATNDIAIYFPYSDLLLNHNKPTIVAADRDADEGNGREPYNCITGKQILCYRNVIVNDEYAVSRPTHIVTAGAEVAVADNPLPPSSASPRIYHGWSRLTKQLDKLISFTGNGGGSEIKVCRINGYLKLKDQQVEDFDGDVVTLDYSRSDIRKGKWKRVYSIWDPEWNYQDAEQIYAVYEEDTKGEKTFSGSLTTTINLPKPLSGKITGEIEYKISVATQDEIVTQRKIGRTSFFKFSKADQGSAFFADENDFLSTGDWPIYDGGTIWSYTMPWQSR